MPFTFEPLSPVHDVVVIEPRVFGDDRGWFMETFKASDFAQHGLPSAFPQDNHSRSVHRGTIRGLHYQLDPTAQGKLVRCVAGAIYDVAVDFRRGSPTFGKWAAVELTAADHRTLWVPPGFGHGFCSLEDGTEVAYKATAEYSAPHDRSVRWNDPDLAIEWPVTDPILSERDAAAPALADAEINFRAEAG